MAFLNCEEPAANFVMNLYISNPIRHPYHNLLHTIEVVNHAKKIAEFYNLGENESCCLIIAAWFHDVGQLFGNDEEHEERSVIIMDAYLKSKNASPDFIEAADKCIMATKQSPSLNRLTEKILCDADTYHFGTMYFRETEFMVKEEMEKRTGKIFPNWHAKSLELLNDHIYYTEFCQLKLNEGKKENIRWLKSLN